MFGKFEIPAAAEVTEELLALMCHTCESLKKS